MAPARFPDDGTPPVGGALTLRARAIRSAWRLVRPATWLWLAAAFLVLMRTATQVALPLLAGGAVDDLGPSGLREHLPFLAATLGGLGLVAGLVRFLYGYGAAMQNLRIGDRVTRDLFARVLRAPLERTYGRPAAEWQNRIQGDVRSLAPLYPHNLILRLSGALSALLLSGFLFWIHWQLMAGMALLAAGAAWLQYQIRRRLRAIKATRMEISVANSSWLADVVGGLPLVKLSCAEDREVAALERRMAVGLRESLRAERLRILATLGARGVRWIVPLAVTLFGLLLVQREAMSTGDLVTFALFFSVVTRGVQSTLTATTSIDDGMVALARLSEILGLEDEGRRDRGRALRGDTIREVVFEDVSFAYPAISDSEPGKSGPPPREASVAFTPDRVMPPTLRGVNLRLAIDRPAVLVGESGVGKSTLMKLLCGFHAPDAGRILVDGVDLRELDVHAYRRRLSLVSHEGYLLGRDFSDNVLYRVGDARDNGRRMEEMTVRLRLEVVRDRERQQRGRRRRSEGARAGALPPDLSAPAWLQVSAGERQRVALLRELLHDAPLWGLDEATSNLDGELEERLLERILSRKGLLILAVSHRFSCIRRFPTVHVMHAGRIVASGSHDALLDGSPEYRRLVLPQMRCLPALAGARTEPLQQLESSRFP